MKTAIYIEDGVTQLVLTPENDFERNAIAAFESKPVGTKIIVGEFYDCRGGWARQRDLDDFVPMQSDSHPRSLIIRHEIQTPIPPA
jgi:hypothetical protein